MKTIHLKDLITTEHKEVLFKQKGKARMILAYHTYGNGICFGGIRLSSLSTEEKAVKDAFRLSEAMTYKLALIKSPYGGCKAVVFEPTDGKSVEFLHNIGELIEEEHGRFISAIDFGFEPDDAKIIREKTKYIFAIKDSEFGQSGVTTAYGVIEGIKISLNEVYNSSEIKGRSFAIQGLGSVGKIITDELINLGGKVYISDINSKKTKQFEGRATIVDTNKILNIDVDVFVPCGPAYIINQNSIPQLRCKIIAGGANCILEDEIDDDKKLYESGILVAPDYVINAGGVMQGIEELTRGALPMQLQNYL
ncbi:leucine dehydrogenase [Candidatus Pacearchaeota archaeon CG10_big_fil_rev_8_21_14_0_10_32_42]|nr:MAG: leucine dehydrogenase [Candidatus Pacearchaeota archaeon CG10_big_fil_rev_8_21_14_0_10_32_42]